jgi:hypothetical protein
MPIRPAPKRGCATSAMAPAYRTELKSGSDRTSKARFDKPAVYLSWTRRSAKAPKGAATPIRSYTTPVPREVQP